jgi:transcription elongation factor GreA
MSNARLTQAGYDRLTARLVELKEKRARIRQEVERARSEGDLSENAGYHAAREALTIQEVHIRTIELRLADAVIIESNGAPDAAEVGCTITLRDVDNEQEMTYRLAEIDEHDDDTPVMTPSSPLGQLVMGKKVDDIIELNSPRGTKRFLLVAITEE